VTQTEPTPSKQTSDEATHDHEMEEYAGGTIQSRHGYIPVWLLVVYAVLFVWGLYYAYYYWGGLGPGRF
jgi:hypothetical protein